MRKAILLSITILILGMIVSGQSPTPKQMPTPPPKQLELTRMDEPVIIVASAGDTVQKLAERFWLDPLELAKYNGLLPNSPLVAGRELKVPPTPNQQTALASMPTPCSVSLRNSPEIKGLKLGMSEREAMEIIGRPFVNDPLGEGYLRYAQVVARVRVQSYDDKVSSILAFYDVKWKNISEFIANFAPKLGLPETGWKKSVYDAQMDCDGFSVTLESYSSSLKIVDMAVPKQIDYLKRRYEEDKKKSIKP